MIKYHAATKITTLCGLIGTLLIAGGMSSPVFANHVPNTIDVPQLWNPMKNDGYLEFINAADHGAQLGSTCPSTPPGVIQTEEFTGFTLPTGADIIEVGDSDSTAGDKADFDWVQQNRPVELAIPPGGNHPGIVGAMGWSAGSPGMSPHVDLGNGNPHNHSVEEAVPPPTALPALLNNAYEEKFIDGVDVFSIISDGQDFDPTPRDRALDYEVAFCNTVTGMSSLGVPTVVWVQGWTATTFIDDYVARWVPLMPGQYDAVAIEPAAGVHDSITEIDAIKAFRIQEVGGEDMSIDNTILFIAGIQSSMVWMIPTIAGLAGTGILVAKFRQNKN